MLPSGVGILLAVTQPVAQGNGHGCALPGPLGSALPEEKRYQQHPQKRIR